MLLLWTGMCANAPTSSLHRFDSPQISQLLRILLSSRPHLARCGVPCSSGVWHEILLKWHFRISSGHLCCKQFCQSDCPLSRSLLRLEPNTSTTACHPLADISDPIRNKPRIRNLPRIRNKESETKSRESETKIRESETKIPRIRNQKSRESETKMHESETKLRESETENQKLKTANQKLKSHESETKLPRIRNQNPPNQKPKTANQKPKPENQKLCWSATMLNTILPSTSLQKKSNPPPPLATMLNRILPSTSLHKKSNLPPPLATMLHRILTSTYP